MKELSFRQVEQILTAGLANESACSDEHKKIRIRKVAPLNRNTLSCEFLPYQTTSIEVKAEIAYITSFIFSFLKDNPLIPSGIQYIAIRAYSNADEEILYSISSLAAAEFISTGNSIEWLKHTIFQDNTDDHRLLLAKRMISKIEDALRRLSVNVLSEQDKNWWQTHVPIKIAKSASGAYKNQLGIISVDGEELIEYTYILNIKDIIIENWIHFRDIFLDKTAFTNNIDSLNKIRRDEAHNRVISIEALKNLGSIHGCLLSQIGNKYPGIVHSFLDENWRARVIEILDGSHDVKPLVTGSLTGAIRYAEQTVDRIDKIAGLLESVVVPPAKVSTHAQLVAVFSSMRSSLEEMLICARNEDVIGVNNAKVQYDASDRAAKDFIESYLLEGV